MSGGGSYLHTDFPFTLGGEGSPTCTLTFHSLEGGGGVSYLHIHFPFTLGGGGGGGVCVVCSFLFLFVCLLFRGLVLLMLLF